MTRRKSYEEKSDLEKIESQWRKLSGLHTREEWSAAIVRAATAAEIAANLVIRREFKTRSQFDARFVDTLLRWANGLRGKIDKLLLPLFLGRKEHASLKKLRRMAESINRVRNEIVHQGIFCNSKEARVAIIHAQSFIEALVRLHHPHFTLKEKKG